MKNIIKFPALIFAVVLLVSSCKKDDNSNSNSSQPAQLSASVQQGSWKITSYIDNGVDQTNHYTGYEFQFNSNGTITATKAGTTISGTWSDGMDDSVLKLVLNFGAATPFLEINDDWHVTQQSAVMIRLQDVSGGGSGTEYLVFEKI